VKTGNYVAYYRVSTKRQRRSGLGLEAQRQAVHRYLDGGDWKLIEEFVEAESGRRSDRPQLQKALKACRVYGATLVIAKLDRLARNVAFIANLMEAGVEFEAVDLPDANRMTLHIMAAMAEQEARYISTRTKEGLEIARQQGKQLGGTRPKAQLTEAGREIGREAQRAQARRRAKDLLDAIEDIRSKGAKSLRDIAEMLNERNISTPRGGKWSATQVARVLIYANETEERA
jgi:DNA invertase Pin-like site-specific DNA recombinase